MRTMIGCKERPKFKLIILCSCILGTLCSVEDYDRAACDGFPCKSGKTYDERSKVEDSQKNGPELLASHDISEARISTLDFMSTAQEITKKNGDGESELKSESHTVHEQPVSTIGTSNDISEGNDDLAPLGGETTIDNTNMEDQETPSLQVIGVGKKRSVEPEPEISARRRLFPYLYPSLLSTVKTFLSFLISELVEENTNQDEAVNTTESSNQSIIPGLLDLVKNSSSNSTESTRKTRFQCAIKNTTAGDFGKVKIVNSTELLEILSLSKSQKLSACVLVLFYAPWCHFCAKTAPHYNALARAFPQLDVLAVDTSHFSYLNARFGTVAVPNVMLFHSRSAVRFNHTHRALDKLTEFVTNNTGLESHRSVLLEPLDFVGPLPCFVRKDRDYLLWLAWIFVAVCSAYGFVSSWYGQNFIARLKILWQEHQHID